MPRDSVVGREVDNDALVATGRLVTRPPVLGASNLDEELNYPRT